ncbi:MAG: hypothetical protein IKV09_02530 [Alistipes sp.]|nr:hypothetical protein [Alistipes sp.]
MAVLEKYTTLGIRPSDAELDELLARYPWFEAVRVVKEGRELLYDIDAEKIGEESAGELIERFLRKGDYRIVAEDGEVEGDVQTEAELDDEDDLVSEELAEIYLAQGLKSQAIEIFRRLSLLNTEKSVYFAEKIEKIEKE